MDNKEVHSPSESPASTSEAWSTILRLQLDSDSPQILPARLNEKVATNSSLSVVDNRISVSAPVLRLPPELLVTIISYCMPGDDFIPAMDHVPSSVPWVRFSWVCRRWRHIMLASPILWPDFVLPLPPQWAHAMLERSQQLPLSVSCSYQIIPPPKDSPDWLLPVDTLDRIQSMHMVNFRGSATYYSRLLSMPAPILEAVTLYSTPRDLPRHALFANSAPRLRYLEIHDAKALPLSSFFPTLIYLNISYVSESTRSLPEYIAALNQLSRIQTLTLEDCLSPFSSASHAPNPSQIAKLPSLERLKIGGEVSECIGFLRHVQTPDTVLLHVAASTRGSADDFATLFPFLAPARGYTADPFRAVQICSYGERSISIRAAHNDVDVDHSSWNRAFEFRWFNFEDTFYDFMRVLCKETGMRYWLSLSMEVFHPRAEILSPAEDWLDIFGAATELKTLCYTGSALCSTLSATMQDGTYGRAAAGNLVWPLLHLLKLERVDLSYCYESSEGSSWAGCAGMRVDDVLLRELENRHRRGSTLDVLHLRDCMADPQWPQWLQKVEAVVGRVFVENVDVVEFA
ncbi:hypothetical protein FA95DRAFT_1561153 [Auriscalpium vulgare]|uniref:Uncharacterized protein n=1 Tax=Auriscalpium vulgare TaxID=40419 RepID=A0ACB8RMT8_9AGAM|nr:hypothetical protein FA95DRAFT_1561153 [Auriscalpium vulgare]